MLIANRKYLMQLIRAIDGNRADPFISTPAAFQEQLIQDFNSEECDKFYVLVLADLSENIKPQEHVSKFPLFTMTSWTNLTFNDEVQENA